MYSLFKIAHTLCPRSLGPFLHSSKLLYEMGQESAKNLVALYLLYNLSLFSLVVSVQILHLCVSTWVHCNRLYIKKNIERVQLLDASA